MVAQWKSSLVDFLQFHSKVLFFFGFLDGWTPGYTFHGDANRVFKEFFGGNNPFAGTLYSWYIKCCKVKLVARTSTSWPVMPVRPVKWNTPQVGSHCPEKSWNLKMHFPGLESSWVLGKMAKVMENLSNFIFSPNISRCLKIDNILLGTEQK